MSNTRRLVVSGASGLIGRHACRHLQGQGWQIQRLVRRRPTDCEREIAWDPAGGQIDAGALSGAYGVVHLAGQSLTGGRWTPQFKAMIRDSRVRGTALLTGALANLDTPPQVLIAASAVGYYGDRQEEILTEDSPPGDSFLAEVCVRWEAACAPAAAAGIRVVNLRLGMVLAAGGGALATMLPAFKMGLGGPMGSGRQYVSWIHIQDLVRVIEFALDGDLQGPVNATAPHSVRNAEFARTLGRALRRPTLFRLPAAGVTGLFGELGRELLLASARVQPTKLQQAGFEFAHPKLKPALQSLLREGGQ